MCLSNGTDFEAHCACSVDVLSRHDVAKIFLATVGAFFDRFASSLEETYMWPRRIKLCKKTLIPEEVITHKRTVDYYAC